MDQKIDQTHCFFCKKVLKDLMTAQFECETHNSLDIPICGLCDHDLSKCDFCKSSPKELESIPKDVQDQPKPDKTVAVVSHFLYLLNCEMNSKNTFPIVSWKQETLESEIFYVSAKPNADDFMVYEYAGIAILPANKFLITGGELDVGTSNEVFLLNFEQISNIYQYTFEKHSILLKARYAHKAFALGEQSFLIAGGMGADRKALKSSEIFKGTQWVSGPELNKTRNQPSGFIKNEYIYLFGGFSGPKIQETSFERLAIKELEKWEEINVKSNDFTHLTACFSLNYGKNVLLLGGSNGKNVTKGVFSWDLEKGEIQPKSTMKYERANLFATVLKGELLVFGGEKDKKVIIEKISFDENVDFEQNLENENEPFFEELGYFWVPLN